MFFPSDFNRISFIDKIKKNELKEKNLQQPEINLQTYQFINLYSINSYVSKNIIGGYSFDEKNPYLFTFETLDSYTWYQEKQELNSSIYNQNDNNALQDIIEVKKDNIHDLYKGQILFDNKYQIQPEDIYKYLNISESYLTSNFQFGENRYPYNYKPGNDKIIQKQYNLLRHAGATMTLCQIYQFIEKKESILKVIESALKYLSSKQEKCPQTKKNALCLHDEQNRIKLGGNGLSLLAFSLHSQITGDKQYMGLMQGLARRIMEVQQENGKFGQHIYNTIEQKETTQEVLYYIGEAMLGLLKLNELDPRPEYVRCVRKGLDYIIQEQGFDHWLMYALNVYNRIEYVQQHIDWVKTAAEQAMYTIKNVQQPLPDFLKTNKWSSYPNGSSIGTTGEGLMQAYLILKRNNQTEQLIDIKQSINKVLIYQNYMQLKPYNSLYFPQRQYSIGGILNQYDVLQIQIDNNQHQASSQIAYLNYLLGKEESM